MTGGGSGRRGGAGVMARAALVATVVTVAGLAALPARAADSAAVADSTRFVVAGGDTVYVAAPVEVVGARASAALPGLVRPVRLVGGSALAGAPVRSVAEALQAVPGVIVGQRQQYGVQGDLTVRGSTFDQVLVLVDGVPAGDPQTGHHALDLPLGLGDVERLEVLPGHGSALYGAGAVGGTLNLVTREPAGRTGGLLAAGGGGDGTWFTRGSLDLAPARTDGARARLSLEHLATDGHHESAADGTDRWAGDDARATTATWRGVGRWGGWDLGSFAGWADRDFGAPDFYAPFPSREATRTFLAWLGADGRVAPRLTLAPRLSVRTHRDRFWLRRENPDAYANDHLTRRFGGELRGLVEMGPRRTLALGVEGAYEDLDSQGLRAGLAVPALGFHARRQAGAYAELDDHGDRLSWQAGLRVDRHSGLAARATGSAAASWQMRRGLFVRAGAGSAFRAPTFTDLYYADPANQGNADVQPERGWTWDAGLALERGGWTASALWFERREKDRIEWARATGATVWQVLNVAEATVRGAETQAGWRHSRGHAVTLAWTRLETTTALAPGYEGKYALLAPRDVLAAQGRLVLPADLAAGAAFRYLSHDGGPDGFRHQAALDLRADWTPAGGWFAGLLLSNALDRARQEVPGVTLPGRLLTASVGRRF